MNAQEYDALVEEMSRAEDVEWRLRLPPGMTPEEFEAYVDPEHPEYRAKDIAFIDGRVCLVEGGEVQS